MQNISHLISSFDLTPYFLIVFLYISHINCNKTLSINDDNSLANKSITIVQSESFDAFQFTFKCLAIIFLLLGFVILIFVNNCVFLICKHFKCFKNDSLCLFLNKELVEKDDTDRDENRIYTIESNKFLINKDQSTNSFRTPLIEVKTQHDRSYYGVKHDDVSVEFCNFHARNLNLINEYRNGYDNNLNSFRSEAILGNNNNNNTELDDVIANDYLDIYNNLANISSNPIHEEDFTQDPFNELENIEKRLSKSLCELNELHRKLCIERSSEIVEGTSQFDEDPMSDIEDTKKEDKSLKYKVKDHDSISMDELTASLINNESSRIRKRGDDCPPTPNPSSYEEGEAEDENTNL